MVWALSAEESLVKQLVEDIKEIVKVHISEETLEKLVMEKLSKKFDEFVKRARGVKDEC